MTTQLLNRLNWIKVGKGERTKAILNGVGAMASGRRRAHVDIGIAPQEQGVKYVIVWKWMDGVAPVSISGLATSIEAAKQLIQSEGFEKMGTAINDTMRLSGDTARDGGKLGSLTNVQ